jgi:hypothetical protein
VPDPLCLLITRVRFKPATPEEVAAGFLGWTSFSIPKFGRIDSITVHRISRDEYSLAYPGRHDLAGRWHPYFRPNNQATHEAIERHVLGELRGRRVLA